MIAIFGVMVIAGWGIASAQENVGDLQQLLGPGKLSAYGNAAMEMANVNQGAAFGGGELPTITTMQSTAGQGNKIGLRGHTDVKGGAALWWQCEDNVDLTGTSQNGFCGRNSGVGVAKKEWGTLFVGNWETPIFDLTSHLALMENTGYWGTGFLLFDSSGTDNDNGNATSFLRRQEHTVNYWTPRWAGFAARLMVSLPATAVASVPVNSKLGSPRLWSVGTSYQRQALYLTGVFEEHQNFNALGTGFGGNDTGWVLGAQYRLLHNRIWFSGLYTRQNFSGGAANVRANVSAWDGSILWKIYGPHTLKLAYDTAGNTEGNYIGPGSAGGLLSNRVYNGGAGGTGAHGIYAWYEYKYSKSTILSFGLVRLANDRNARYAISELTAPAPGTRQFAIICSVKYRFNFALIN
jgi:predicted porin